MRNKFNRLLFPLKEKEAGGEVPFKEDIVSFVKAEFNRRQKERIPFELQWQLNINFLNGNQYCDIDSETSSILTIEKLYEYQERLVYNNIAPIIETRLSKICGFDPKITIVSATNDSDDVHNAEFSNALIKSLYEGVNMKNIIKKSTNWSEICGTSFYKQVWNNNGGHYIGEYNGRAVYEGDISETVCPPYEIYPDSAYVEDLSDLKSIIHAKPYTVNEIKDLWGVELKGQNVPVFSLAQNTNISGGLGYSSCVENVISGSKDNSDIVIEYYEKPSVKYPKGRLIITAYYSDALLYYGDLPYKNGKCKKRDFPFVKQISERKAGCFWGTSVIERLIPIQRDYNALQNRINEYLNRASVGIPLIEDGSVDIDAIECEGFAPGTPIVYNVGSTPPRFMDTPPLPEAFIEKQDRLENAFIVISGTSEISRNSSTPSNVTSGVALEILSQQDDLRLNAVIDNVKECILCCVEHWINLYKEFGSVTRLLRLSSTIPDVDVVAWKNCDLSADDIVIESEADVKAEVHKNQENLFKILDSGLLNKECGIKRSDRARILSAFMYDNSVKAQSTDMLNILRAERENARFIENSYIEVRNYDDHELHIEEHEKLRLTADFEEAVSEMPEIAEKLEQHINIHKELLGNYNESI